MKEFTFDEVKDFYIWFTETDTLFDEDKNDVVFYGGTVPYLLDFLGENRNDANNYRLFEDIDLYVTNNRSVHEMRKLLQVRYADREWRDRANCANDIPVSVHPLWQSGTDILTCGRKQLLLKDNTVAQCCIIKKVLADYSIADFIQKGEYFNYLPLEHSIVTKTGRGQENDRVDIEFIKSNFDLSPTKLKEFSAKFSYPAIIKATRLDGNVATEQIDPNFVARIMD